MPVPIGLFSYDHPPPLLFSVEAEDARGDLAFATVRYDDGLGGVVSARAVRPACPAGVLPGVILAHGGFEGGKHLFLDQATAATAWTAMRLPASTASGSSGATDR